MDTSPHTRPDIALLLPTLEIGGAERAMLNLAEGFVARGLTVDLVVGEARGPYLDQVPPGVRLVNLQAVRLRQKLLTRCATYLHIVRPRHLIANISHLSLVAIWARRLAGVDTRIAICEQSTLSRYVAGTPLRRGDLLVRLMPWLARIFYPWADSIICISQGVADDLARTAHLPRAGLRVIYNPIVSPALERQAQEPVEHPWLQSGEPPVLLAVGRLVRAKDFPTLLRAFALVAQERLVRLLIVGEGEERSVLEDLVQQLGLTGKVELPGYTINPFSYMKRARLFVLSSRWEGLANVVVEALACGTPVVATDCEHGPREILADGQYGPLVPIEQPEALAAAIRMMLDQPPEPAPLIQRAQDFTIDRAVDATLTELGIH